MMRGLSLMAHLGLLGALIGCGESIEPEYRLVGVYDASSVVGLDPELPRDYLWRAAKGMDESCGPAKGADGIGLYDADLIANRMSPTLAIVLEHNLDIDEYLEQKKSQAKMRAQAAMGSAFDVEKWEREWNVKEGKNRRRDAVTQSDLAIALGIDEAEYRLSPAVMPRHIAVRIDGDDSNIRYQQLVRTQFEVELCMEHKVGRGWIGNDGKRLRQAFLLDKPEGDGKDRRYFGGQRDPVPSLLGPPDACLRVSDSLQAATSVSGGKGEGAMGLVPADVWGAALRNCSAFEGKGQRVLQPARTVPLQLSDVGDPQGRDRDIYWSDLVIEVGSGERDEDINVTVTYENKWLGDRWNPKILEDRPLFPTATDLAEEMAAAGLSVESNSNASEKKEGMRDLMAGIPHIYPTIGPRYDPDRYVVLMVPNWQITEGLRRLFDRQCEDAENRCICTVTEHDGSFTCLNDYGDECTLSEEAEAECAEQLDLDNPMPSGGLGIQDGVGWVLENPSLLYVLVDSLQEKAPPPENAFDRFAAQVDAWWADFKQGLPAFLGGGEAGQGDEKLNLAIVTQGGPLGMQDWGYTVGQKVGRSSIALPISESPTWSHTREAQRARQHSAFLLAFGTLLGFLILGVRRISDLWTRTPDERAYYWPGRQSQKEQEEVDPEGVEASAEGNEG
jgi:hypothetical protein